jgi:hypothetical protein
MAVDPNHVRGRCWVHDATVEDRQVNPHHRDPVTAGTPRPADCEQPQLSRAARQQTPATDPALGYPGLVNHRIPVTTNHVTGGKPGSVRSHMQGENDTTGYWAIGATGTAVAGGLARRFPLRQGRDASPKSDDFRGKAQYLPDPPL